MVQHLSYWEKDSFLENNDVLIIGAGIVGLSAALELREHSPSLNITVIEQGSLPSGASTKNAGFACFGSLSELLDDLEHHQEDEVFALAEKRWKGLLKLRERLGDFQIDYQGHGGYEVFGIEDQASYEQCSAALEKVNYLLKEIIGDANVFVHADQELNSLGLRNFQHMILNRFEGQLHTGKMVKALLQRARLEGIQILNGIKIQRFEEKANEVISYSEQGWAFKSQQVLICTNGFTRQLFPSLDVSPARNQVLITHPIPGLKLKGTFHFNKGYVYFRNVDNRILLGGGRHLFMREESTEQFGLTDEIQVYLEEFMDKHLVSQATIANRWSGILGVGDQKKPIIQPYSDKISTAVRLGGMGVAIGSLVGAEGAEMVLEKL